MAEPYLGQISLFGFNFAPRNWALCQGQLLSISQNTALFSLLGTVYGGDGRVTFGLPNLQGNVPISQGQGPGLTNYAIGTRAGVSTVTLLDGDVPAHSHSFNATTTQATTAASTGGQLAKGQAGNAISGLTSALMYSPNAPTTPMTPNSIGFQGGSQPHNNMQPYLSLNYCIALNGIFPPRQ